MLNRNVNIPIIKVCSKCSKAKETTLFSKDKRAKDGFDSRCKECKNKSLANWRGKNPEKHKEAVVKWRRENPEKNRAKVRKWQRANPEKRKVLHKKWREKNKQKISNWSKQWRAKNSEKIKAYDKLRHKTEHFRKQRKDKYNTLRGKLNTLMSNGVRACLLGKKSNKRWELLVAYSVDQLKRHLERHFMPGMNWNNYGKDGWHIDHIIPKARFNFTYPEDLDFKKCWALKNLQPLWAKENLIKHTKINEHFQPSLLMGA